MMGSDAYAGFARANIVTAVKNMLQIILFILVPPFGFVASVKECSSKQTV